jgi:NADH dehydrogenase [ubiquinone] 1 alpha subcomplex assembly factor 6
MLKPRPPRFPPRRPFTQQCIRHSSTTAPTVPSSRLYCQSLLQKHDYPAYLQTAFLPPSSRDAHLAIRALNIEMALIPDTISNATARVMRMQFWRDAVEDCFRGRPKAEPVSILLAEVLQNGARLTKSFFQNMVSERVCSPCSPSLDSFILLFYFYFYLLFFCSCSFGSRYLD